MRYGLFAAIGIVFALAGYAALKFTGKKEAPAQQVSVVVDPKPVVREVATKDILVASREIPIGTKLEADMYDRQPWPQNLVLDQFIVSGDKDPGVVGMVTRSSFQAREPLIRSKLANPNDPGFFAAALPDGKRAVTVATDMVNGVSGFVYPGDRVDVLFTHDNPAVEAKNLAARKRAQKSGDAPILDQPERVTEVLLHNIKVLAINQQSTGGTAEKLPVPTAASLEVTAEEAQKLRLAEKKGNLSLALRSLKDKDNADIATPTEEKDLSRVDTANFVLPPEELEEKPSITVVRGVRVEKSEQKPANDNAPAPAAAAKAATPTAENQKN